MPNRQCVQCREAIEKVFRRLDYRLETPLKKRSTTTLTCVRKRPPINCCITQFCSGLVEQNWATKLK
ncbi:hypothetical protein pipiens_014258 [Culex pipiens pipiens]|uniref:Saposin B-type domain-containing protein n=1 Tax=Culex pipiens pipiens TaxID=38569 RepID=A0ABD1CVF7_CULPP